MTKKTKTKIKRWPCIFVFGRANKREIEREICAASFTCRRVLDHRYRMHLRCVVTPLRLSFFQNVRRFSSCRDLKERKQKKMRLASYQLLDFVFSFFGGVLHALGVSLLFFGVYFSANKENKTENLWRFTSPFLIRLFYSIARRLL